MNHRHIGSAANARNVVSLGELADTLAAVPAGDPAADPDGDPGGMTAYVLTAAAMSLPALGVLRCCCRRRVFTAASASLSTRPSGALIIDTDCALDDLATLALAAATGTSLQLVTTVNGLAPPGHGHELVRPHGQSASLGSAPARLCASSGQLGTPREGSGPPGAQPLPRLLERACLRGR